MLKKFDSYLKRSRWLRVTLIVFGVVLLGGYFTWGIFRNFGFLLTRATPFPVNLHSALQANYQSDPDYMQIPPMDIQLVVDAIWDQNQNVQDLSIQLTQVNDNFLAQVNTVTPRPTSTNTSESPEETATLIPQIGTESPPSSTPSITPIGFVASSTPTSEPIPPTETTTGATTTSSPQTSTAPPPTNTVAPPTNTPIPPTNTVAVCGQLSAGGFHVSTGTKKATWTITNNGSSAILIKSFTITWPTENGNLTKIKFGPSNVWSGTASPPSKSVSGSWPLGGNSSKDLLFFFDSDSLPSGYNLSINYGTGCSLTKSN